MHAIINGMLWLPKEVVTEELLEQFRYSSPFPDVEPIVSYRFHSNNFVGFPAGSQEIIERVLDIQLDIEDHRVSPKFDNPCNIKFGEPRDYTTAIAFLANKLKVKLIVISHLTILLDQIEAELNMFLNADIGKLTSSSTKVHDISLITIQALNRSPILQKLCQKAFGMVIVEEFDCLLSTNYITTIQRLHAKRVIFTSATPSRELIGLTPLVAHLSANTVNMVPTMSAITPVTVARVPMPMHCNAGSNMNRRAKNLQKFYSRDDVRESVVELITSLLASPRPLGVWLICNIQGEQDYYNDIFEKSCIIASHIPKKQRDIDLERFKNGELNVIIGSATMSAGISIPYMGFAIRLATHSSSSELLTQQIGRLRRQHKDKTRAIFIDLVFSGLSDKTRKPAYNNLNSDDAVTVMSYDKLLDTIKTKL